MQDFVDEKLIKMDAFIKDTEIQMKNLLQINDLISEVAIHYDKSEHPRKQAIKYGCFLASTSLAHITTLMREECDALIAQFDVSEKPNKETIN